MKLILFHFSVMRDRYPPPPPPTPLPLSIYFPVVQSSFTPERGSGGTPLFGQDRYVILNWARFSGS